MMRQNEWVSVFEQLSGNPPTINRLPLDPDARIHINRVAPLWALSLLTVLLLTLFSPEPSAYAAANRIIDQSASATGQSAAFTAQADDPSAIYYNPAGMAHLEGVQVSLGTLLIGGDTSFENASGQKATGNFAGDVLWPPPSQVYVTANLKDLGITALRDLSAGVGILSPFGTVQRWPENGPFNEALTSAAFELIDVKPTLAYKFNEQLSFGLGADIYTFFDFWGEGQFEQKFNSSVSGFTSPFLPPGLPMEINGTDTEPGFNVSLLYTPFRNEDGKPLVNVGFIYRSQAVMKLDGKLLVNGAAVADAETTVVIPQVYTGAIAYWPIRDKEREWKLEVDVDYTGWKSIRNLDAKISNCAACPAPNFTIPFETDWRSTFTVMVGTEHKWLRPATLPDWEVAARGGYWFSETPVRDRGFTPAIPDSDNHSISVGLGLTCKGNGRFLGLFECGRGQGSKWRPKAIVLDTAFQVLLYEDRTVSGATNVLPSQPPNPIDGDYETTYYIGSINLTAKW